MILLALATKTKQNKLSQLPASPQFVIFDQRQEASRGRSSRMCLRTAQGLPAIKLTHSPCFDVQERAICCTLIIDFFPPFYPSELSNFVIFLCCALRLVQYLLVDYDVEHGSPFL